MKIESYGNTQSKKHRRLKRRLTGVLIIILIVLTGAFIIGAITTNGPAQQSRMSILDENHALKAEIQELNEKIADLEKQLEESKSAQVPTDETESGPEGEEVASPKQ